MSLFSFPFAFEDILTLVMDFHLSLLEGTHRGLMPIVQDNFWAIPSFIGHEVTGYSGAAQRGLQLGAVALPQWLPCLSLQTRGSTDLPWQKGPCEPAILLQKLTVLGVQTQPLHNTTPSPGGCCHLQAWARQHEGHDGHGVVQPDAGITGSGQWWPPPSPELAAGRCFLERREQGREQRGGRL